MMTISEKIIKYFNIDKTVWTTFMLKNGRMHLVNIRASSYIPILSALGDIQDKPLLHALRTEKLMNNPFVEVVMDTTNTDR